MVEAGGGNCVACRRCPAAPAALLPCIPPPGLNSARPRPCCAQVTEGSGKMMIVAVGEASEWGKTMALVTTAGSEETPLQEKLGHVASTVGKIGGSVAATCFVALLIK